MNEDREDLIHRVRLQAAIDDPTAGWSDPDAFEQHSLVWPDDRWDKMTLTRSITSPERDVWEYAYTRSVGDPLDVPVAFVWDKTNEDQRARVYFNKAHFGLKEPRRPLVQPDGIEPPAELARYHRAITSGDRALLEEALHPDAVFHSPVGPLTAAQFIEAFSNPADGKPGVPLQFCTITTTGNDHAVEFISWRRPPHGGLGVYSFDNGKLRSVRVYEGPVYR